MGKYKNKNEFKKIKKKVCICLLFIKALKININMLIFKTTLNKDPVNS
tara:strand:- start:297 stop:440 length:144 start_codon:yes stop_codon:yes gene_type:complete